MTYEAQRCRVMASESPKRLMSNVSMWYKGCIFIKNSLFFHVKTTQKLYFYLSIDQNLWNIW